MYCFFLLLTFCSACWLVFFVAPLQQSSCCVDLDVTCSVWALRTNPTNRSRNIGWLGMPVFLCVDTLKNVYFIAICFIALWRDAELFTSYLYQNCETDITLYIAGADILFSLCFMLFVYCTSCRTHSTFLTARWPPTHNGFSLSPVDNLLPSNHSLIAP